MLRSVVMLTHNRKRLVGANIEALLRQDADFDWELVVVDDGSTDGTPDLVEKMAERSPIPMRVIRHRPGGCVPVARNIALREARGERVFMTDDDCIPRPDWLRTLDAGLDEHRFVCGAVASAMRPYTLLAHNVSEFHPFMRRGMPRYVRFAAGANMAVRRKLYEELGGFAEDREGMHAEDMEFLLKAQRAGVCPWYLPDAVVEHAHARRGLRSLMAYSRRHASSTIVLRQRYADVMDTPLVLRSPTLLLLLSPLAAAYATARTFGAPEMWRYLHVAPVVYLTKSAWCIAAAGTLSGRLAPFTDRAKEEPGF
jgi:glycosyltransferase involved in cell wall biosynthesis